MATQQTETNPEPLGKSPEQAYEVVAFQELWGLLSLGLFFLSLTTPYTVRFLPRSIPGWGPLPLAPLIAVFAVPVLSALGIVVALLAGRRRTVTGRIGFFLNTTVFVLSLALAVLAAVWFAVLR